MASIVHYGRKTVAISSCLVSLAHAAPPIAYDNWSVNAGAVTATCPTGATCTVMASDNGFLNQSVELGGKRYFQIILTDPNVTGDARADSFSAGRGNLQFSDEVLVLTNGRTDLYTTALATKMRITQSEFTSPTLEQRADLSTIFQIGATGTGTGEFVDTIHNNTYSTTSPFFDYTKEASFDVQIRQAISTVDYSGTSPLLVYSSTASIREFLNRYDATKKFDQYIDMGDGGSQVFRHWSDSGIFQDSSHAANSLSPLLPGGTNGGDIAWGPASIDPKHVGIGGDKVSVTYVGYQDSQNNEFAFTKFLDQSSAAVGPVDGSIYSVETSLASHVSANPGGWHAAFGTAPNPFDGPQVVAATAIVPPASTVLSGTQPHKTPLSGTGVGGPPIAYDGYTVSNGVITAECPTGAVCSINVADNGFLQRAISVGGETYFQTIITAESASGDPKVAKVTYGNQSGDWFNEPVGVLSFSNESFTLGSNGGGSGVASTLAWVNYDYHPVYPGLIREVMDYKAEINTGWAQGGAADPVLKVSQNLGYGDGTDSYGRTWFDMKMLQDESKDISIKSTFGMLSSFWPIDFVTRILQGSYVTTARAPLSGGPLLPQGSNGGDISWTAGDSIQATWVGGMSFDRFNVAAIFPFMTESFTNLTTGATTSFTDLTTSQPVSWPGPFGATPVWDLDAKTPPN